MSYAQPDDWLQVDRSLDFQHEELDAFLEIWRRRCVNARLPSRSDFEPSVFAGHLGWIVLTDVEHEPLRFRFRLIGSNVAEMAGRDVTGRYLDEVYSPEVHRVVTAGYRAAVELRQPVRVHGYFRQVDRGFMTLESLELPLSSDGRTVDMLMVRDCIEMATDQRPALSRAAEPPESPMSG